MTTVRDVYERRRTNLRKLIDERYDGVDRNLSRRSGISPGYLSKLFGPEGSPDARHLGDEKARAIEIACNLPVGWLDVDQNNNGPRNGANALKVRALMILKSDEVTPFIRRGKEPPDPEFITSPAADLGSKAFAYRIVGDAMVGPATSSLASLPDGCVVIVDPQQMWRSGSLVLCQLGRNGQVVCRRYLESDTGSAVLTPLNPLFQQDGHVAVNSENVVLGTVMQTVMQVGPDGTQQPFSG